MDSYEPYEQVGIYIKLHSEVHIEQWQTIVVHALNEERKGKT